MIPYLEFLVESSILSDCVLLSAIEGLCSARCRTFSIVFANSILLTRSEVDAPGGFGEVARVIVVT